ncbi:SCO4225 family membrane protein [Streptomyces sp. NPDC096033]|uniref:SCO4225 family membrane protein n=1 Tax=Streptomyces sp. NPDC096033 TaxID=3366071 RepID=UPI003806929A
MRRQRSRLEVWVPTCYLAVVAGLLVWVDVLVRTGDAGLAGVWPMLATAPLSLPVMRLIEPDPESLGVPAPVGPAPADPGAYGMPGTELPDMWLGFGFYGVILACALVNATALWALLRGLTGLLARRGQEPVG